MCRICLIHAQPNFCRVGKQACIQQGLLTWICAECLFLVFICLLIGWIFELALQNCCCTHCRAATIEGTPSGKAKPCFIPEKYQVGLYCEALLHDPLDVINVTIKGTVCKDQKPRPV